MTDLLIPAGTIPGRTIPIGGSCHHGLAAGLANMSSGSTVIVCRPADLTTGDAYIWGRTESGQVYHAFRFTGTQVRHFIGRGTTNFNFLVDYAALPGLAVGEWIALAHTWDISGATADQRLYIGRPHAPLIEATAYATVTLGAGTLTDDSALNFRLWARGGASNGLVGEGHGAWIKKGTLLPRDELQAIADAMWRGLPLDLLAPTAAWYTGANDAGPVLDYGSNGYTGTLSSTTAGSAPPLAPLPRARTWRVAQDGPTTVEVDAAAAGQAVVTGVAGATKGVVASAAGVAVVSGAAAAVVGATESASGVAAVTGVTAAVVAVTTAPAGVATPSIVSGSIAGAVVNAGGSTTVTLEGADAAASGSDVAASGQAVVSVVGGATQGVNAAGAGAASVTLVGGATVAAVGAVAGLAVVTGLAAATRAGVVSLGGTTTPSVVSGSIAGVVVSGGGSSLVECEGTDASSSGVDTNVFGQAVVTGRAAAVVAVSFAITGSSSVAQAGAAVAQAATAVIGVAATDMRAALVKAATTSAQGLSMADMRCAWVYAAVAAAQGIADVQVFYLDPTLVFTGTNTRAIFRHPIGLAAFAREWAEGDFLKQRS